MWQSVVFCHQSVPGCEAFLVLFSYSIARRACKRRRLDFSEEGRNWHCCRLFSSCFSSLAFWKVVLSCCWYICFPRWDLGRRESFVLEKASLMCLFLYCSLISRLQPNSWPKYFSIPSVKTVTGALYLIHFLSSWTRKISLMLAICFVGGPSCTQKRSKHSFFISVCWKESACTANYVRDSCSSFVRSCFLTCSQKICWKNKALNLECLLMFFSPERKKIQPNSCLCYEMEIMFLWFSIAHLGYTAELLIVRTCKRRYSLAN